MLINQMESIGIEWNQMKSNGIKWNGIKSNLAGNEIIPEEQPADSSQAILFVVDLQLV